MTTSDLTGSARTAHEPAMGDRAPGVQPVLVRLAHQVEDDTRLDGAVAALKSVAEAVDALPGSAELLHGRPVGHAVHPFLTDVPIGAWTSACLLDLIGGEQSRDAATRLVGVGVLAAVPTALTGLAEWNHTEGRDARVGVAHAAGNSVALTLFGMSWVSRRKGHHRKGALLSLAGLAVGGVSAFLGGHLAIARDVGTRDRSFADAHPPATT